MKTLSFAWDGKEHELALGSAISRDALYGKARKLVLDPEGKELAQGFLTPRGELLEPRDISNLQVDAAGSFIGTAQYEKDGEIAEKVPSSFKETRQLKQAPADLLTRFAVTSVYPVETPEDFPSGLYESTFNYTVSVEPHTCLLLARETGNSFLLIGYPMDFTPVGKAATYNLFDADDSQEDTDDADFGFDMF